MKSFSIAGSIFACFLGGAAMAVGAGTVATNGTKAAVATGGTDARAITNANMYGNAYNTNSNLRGNQGAINAYKQNQRNNYYMVNVPDVDSACRQKIYKCLTDYCGDVTIVPGQVSGRCAYATESELYNYALLCLQKDTSVLLPQYNTNNKMGIGGLNTAAHLCPSYVQQELMSYLSMANMADQLTKSHSPQCLQRRQELEAAMACHSVALAYGNETSSMLTSQLNDFCGAGVQGGSAEMVTRFANAGNVGANIWGWAEKVVTLDVNKKGADWQSAVDAVLASYTNRMNLACGDNLQLNLQDRAPNAGQPTGLQAAAAIAVSSAFPNTTTTANVGSGADLYMNVRSMTDVYKYDDAYSVVQAGLTNSVLTQNAFLTSNQMDDMQRAYRNGTKVFVLRDSARCFVIQVAELTQTETSLLGQALAGCTYK